MDIIRLLKKKDFLCFLIIPILVNIVIYNLPNGIKGKFILEIKSPTLLAMYFSNFTHTDLSHLAVNMLLYAIYLTLAFSIMSDINRFRLFGLSAFLVVPFLSSSMLTKFYPVNGNALGFSGIVAALMGYYIYPLYEYLKKQYMPELDLYRFVISVFAINILIWSLFTPGILIILLALFLLMISGLHLIKDIKIFFIHYLAKYPDEQKMTQIKAVIRDSIYISSAFAITLIIPKNITISYGSINLLGHAIGYMYGLLLPLGFIGILTFLNMKKN